MFSKIKSNENKSVKYYAAKMDLNMQGVSYF